jgi:hypothetical protein
MKEVYASSGIGLSTRDFVKPESLGVDSLDCEALRQLEQSTFGRGGGFDDDDLFN